MGLLNRRRSAPGADRGSAVSAAPPAPAAATGAPDVIRAGSFHQVPEWAKVAPMELSLPEMPSVVSKHFEDSLTSWQAPPRFLGSLGHSVTPEAPAGVVQGMALTVAPIPPSEPAPAGAPAADLPLAVAPQHLGDSGRRAPDASVRRLSSPFLASEGEAPAPSGGSVENVTEPVVPTAAVTPEPPPSGLVGTEPLVAPAEPLVAPLLPPAAPSPFVSAPIPPELPLAQLPSARLPAAPAPARGSEPTAPAEQSPSSGPAAPSVTADGPMAGLVGERPVVLPPEPSAPAAPPSEPAATDLPLAIPAPAAGPTPASQTRRLEDTAGGAGSLESPASGAPSGPAEAGSAEAGSAEAGSAQAGSAEVVPAQGAAPEVAPGGLLSPAQAGPTGVEPTAEAPDAPMAPLVGHAPPLTAGRPEVSSPTPPTSDSDGSDGGAAAAPPLVMPPSPRPRAGLGEPIAEVPSTARSWDITRMSRAEQLQASRSLIQNQIAASARNMPPVGAPMAGFPPGARPLVAPVPPGAAPPGPLPLAGPSGSPSSSPAGRRAPAGPVLAGMALPVAPIESIGPASVGVEPGDLPAAGPVQAPLLGASPMFTPRAESAPAAAPPEGQRARTEIGGRYGVDLSHVPVDRSPQGAAEASRLRARAFTSDLAVVIPAAAGTLEHGAGEALLSHELTHVAQRAHSGPNLPSEDSAAGRVLEGEALATEMTLTRAGAGRTVVGSLPGPRAANTWAGTLGGQANAPEGAPPLPLASSSSSTLDPDSLANTIMERLSGLTTTAPIGSAAFGAPLPVSAPAAPAVSAGPIQRAAEAPVLPDAPVTPTGSAPVGSGGSGEAMERPSDEDLSNLSRWLYPLIKYRLKGELREDRERAGLLTDHYRRW